MEGLEEYILSHIDQEPDLLKELDRKAHVRLINPRMISGHLQGRILKMFTHMVSPQNVLEIGTFIGYSTLCIAEALKENAKLQTIEINDELEDFIRENIEKSNFNDKIDLHIGDAFDIIPTFDEESFDLVFMDADKRLYCEHYELVLPKLRKGGFILADNTLWNGKVVDKVGSNDWQTKGIIDFNRNLCNDHRVEKVILPLRDGLTIIRKK